MTVRHDLNAERLAAIERGGGPKAPKDPTKPLTRSMRQIINHLSWGGRLYKVKRSRRETMYYVLEVARPSAQEVMEKSISRWLKEPRRVQNQTVATMIAKGYLRSQWFDPDEATRIDLLPKALEVRDKTDSNGNWRDRTKKRSSLPPIDLIAPKRRRVS